PALIGHAEDAFNFAELEHFIIAHPDNLWIHIGAVLVLCGIAFKIGAVPFQIWVPDVYQGAPTPVTAFLAVASKAAGFVVLLNLIKGPFAPLAPVLIPLLSAIAAVTILFGNIAALTQRNTKRLMGLSGIAHAGYLLVGVVASFRVEWAAGAVIFYLFTYLLGSFAVFGVMALQRPEEDMWQTLDDYENLRKKQPYLATILTIGIGSLAGIPPLVGFIGKFLLFVAAYQAGLYNLLGVAIIGVVISIYYYFGWIRSAYFRSWDLTPEEEAAAAELKVGVTHRLVLGIVAFATVALGFYQATLSVHLF
ncbi:MAG TPA: NADH-quinone oxidoreductase subunit N, partial [Opitutae bacterium]|nr:NADH-quinone oxidoreductase subunit N [Opitutae bacterium]